MNSFKVEVRKARAILHIFICKCLIVKTIARFIGYYFIELEYVSRLCSHMSFSRFNEISQDNSQNKK